MATRVLGTLGPYRILGEIGSGGMSTIYRGEQTSLDRPVAIKELLAPLAADEEMALRFEREAKASAALSHQNIVQIFDFIRKGRSAYIVMEYVDGVDLAAVLRTVGRLPLHLALPLAYQVCLALEHAHRRGLVHRDVKPSNVMISTEGRVKLMDFGIAHLPSETLTQPGAFLGTPAYMSPEQVMGGKVGPASDVFSFGILLYEMLAGRRPFVEDATGAVVQKITEGRYPDPRRVVPGLPRGVARLIRRCLQVKPDARYRDATEMRVGLEAHLSKPDLTGAPRAVVRFLAERGIFHPRVVVEPPRASAAPRLWRGARVALKVAAVSLISAQWLTAATLGAAGRHPSTRPAVLGLVVAAVSPAVTTSPAATTSRPVAPSRPVAAAAGRSDSGREGTSTAAGGSAGGDPVDAVPAAPAPLRPPVPVSQVTLAIPDGVELWLDDRPVVGHPERGVELPPGRHLVELRRGGLLLQRFDLEAAERLAVTGGAGRATTGAPVKLETSRGGPAGAPAEPDDPR